MHGSPVVRSSLMNLGVSRYCYPYLPVSCQLAFSLCGSVCSKSLIKARLKQPLTTVLWTMIHRHSNGPNYNITIIRPFKPFHGRHTRVIYIYKPPRPLESQVGVTVTLLPPSVCETTGAMMLLNTWYAIIGRRLASVSNSWILALQ